MINIYPTKKVYCKTLDKFSKFVLIGNDIDGFVNVNIVEFSNFEEVKSKLPKVLMNLRYEGEWNLSLYQIPDNFKVKNLYGRYRVPFRGKLILDLSYMNIQKHVVTSLTDAMIHIYSHSDVYMDNRDDVTGQMIDGTVYEEYITVMLNPEIRKNKNLDQNMKVENDLYYSFKSSEYSEFLIN